MTEYTPPPRPLTLPHVSSPTSFPLPDIQPFQTRVTCQSLLGVRHWIMAARKEKGEDDVHGRILGGTGRKLFTGTYTAWRHNFTSDIFHSEGKLLNWWKIDGTYWTAEEIQFRARTNLADQSQSANRWSFKRLRQFCSGKKDKKRARQVFKVYPFGAASRDLETAYQSIINIFPTGPKEIL